MNSTSILINTQLAFSRFEQLGRMQLFEKNQLILAQNTVPSCCYFICQGRVMGYECSSSGDEIIYSILESHMLFAEANLLTNRPSAVSFKAAKNSELLCIDKPSLLMAMEEDPQLMSDILHALSDKFIEAMDEVRDMKNHTAIWRLCKLLLTLAERYGISYDNKILIREHISIQTLTSMMGVNRATTVRSLKLLRDLGLVEHINGYYCIRSTESLRRHQELLENL